MDPTPGRRTVHKPRYVVGLGASAGGLEALKAFFAAMPEKTGLAFVVVMHLDPTHESLMAELLAHVTVLMVEQARDRQPVRADHVYVIPPNRTLTIDHGLLRVQEVADRRSLRGAIDYFLRSLADDRHESAIAIVLSGSGTEGTLGARAVKAEGGLVMAQAPDTAAQPGMPASAIAAGVVDVVLAPDKMPQALLAYVRDTHTHHPPASPEARPLEGLAAVLALLRARTKHDFRGYKKGTLQRRIERRMGLQQIADLTKYVALLRHDPAELDQLFKDLLIGVTSFFRDPQAFDELAGKAMAELVRGRDPDTPIRVWVPGCSTGEEAYSIAITLAEQLSLAHSGCRAQIFATDVDENALSTARSGTYSESIALDVSPQRLQRFFTHADHQYTVSKSIRESVTFAIQNVASDPPFSKLDLVSCRNVLIYLEPEIQEKLLSVFHFALNPGGYLFLGGAEGVGVLEELFTPVSKRRRIFRRIGPAARPPLEFPKPAMKAGPARAGANVESESPIATLAEQQLLKHFAPAAVVVRSSGHIVRFHGALERYMKLPAGEATLDVLMLARDPLKPTLRAALHEAVRRNRQAVLELVDNRRDRMGLRITVEPVVRPQTAERLWLIVFEEAAPAVRVGTRKAVGRQPNLTRRLEAELRTTRKEQQHLIEQLEGSNEELQSTNEELTTSKEELQSMNEELTTLNAQLQDKVHEVTVINDDLANLLVSTDIVTVFLDHDLRIKRFTTAASQVLNLRPVDTGRPLNHIASNLVDVDLTRESRAVLEGGVPFEKEVAAHDGKQYVLRGLPYRTTDRRVQGVVLTLVDVTSLKQVERQLRMTGERVDEQLRRMTRLHQATVRLAGPGEVPSYQEEILRAVVDITGAPKGDVQRFDDSGALTIVAQVGFERPFLEFFARLGAHADSPCAAARASQQRVVIEDVETSPVLDGAGSRAVLLAASVRAVQSTPLFDRFGRFLGMLSTHYLTPHLFDEDELRWLDLLARHAADVFERGAADEQLARVNEELERRVADRTRWLALIHDVTRAINDAPSWNVGLNDVLQRICEAEHWQVGTVYMSAQDDSNVVVPVISHLMDERFRPFQLASERRRYARGEQLPGRVYADGRPQWVNGQDALLGVLPARGAVAKTVGLQSSAALPIKSGTDVIAVLELFSDREHPPNVVLADLMNDLGDQISKVLERERATAQMADLVWREQQGLLHTLHDSLGQTLTGLGMLSAGLRQQLTGTNQAAAATAAQVAEQARSALEQVRQLSRGLFPVDVDPNDLLAALRELASTTEAFHKIRVQVVGDLPDSIRDGHVATQLYRIAQEAVTNAVKHARAQMITIEIGANSGVTTLRVLDDGVGMPTGSSKGSGLGLRIMRYRATSIGALLSITAGAGGGTIVTCSLQPVPMPSES